jgi:hypothetical protein
MRAIARDDRKTLWNYEPRKNQTVTERVSMTTKGLRDIAVLAVAAATDRQMRNVRILWWGVLGAGLALFQPWAWIPEGYGKGSFTETALAMLAVVGFIMVLGVLMVWPDAYHDELLDRIRPEVQDLHKWEPVGEMRQRLWGWYEETWKCPRCNTLLHQRAGGGRPTAHKGECRATTSEGADLGRVMLYGKYQAGWERETILRLRTRIMAILETELATG